MNANEKKPIIEKVINFPATKGLYKFFCKTTAKLFCIVFAILSVLCGNTAADPIASGDNARKLVSCIWLVNHMKRKLQGITSISSSVHDNAFCAAFRKLKDCICAHCYAYNQQAYQTGLKEHNIINGIILRNVLLPIAALKKLVIMFPYLRIESFGDVANVIQARNYIRIIKAFPRKRCAIWTKNIEIWHKAFLLEGKPENTTFVVSSRYVNKALPVEITKEYPEIDHIFTVYTKQFAKKNNIVINCGGRKCLDCIKAGKACYYRNTELFINELKK